jgi:hypothetical protein
MAHAATVFCEPCARCKRLLYWVREHAVAIPGCPFCAALRCCAAGRAGPWHTIATHTSRLHHNGSLASEVRKVDLQRIMNGMCQQGVAQTSARFYYPHLIKLSLYHTTITVPLQLFIHCKVS